jgi:hypothetical protein
LTGGTSVTFAGEVNTSADSVTINGSITDTQASDQTFSNVTVYAYAANETLLRNTHIGTLETRLDVTLSLPADTATIVICSPDFWPGSGFSVEYLHRTTEGKFVEMTAATPAELPVRPTAC